MLVCCYRDKNTNLLWVVMTNNTQKREKNCPSSNNKINCNQRSLFSQECQRSSPPGLHNKKKLLFILHSPHKRNAYLYPQSQSQILFSLVDSHPLGQQIEELSLTASGDAKFQLAESLGLEFQPPWC